MKTANQASEELKQKLRDTKTFNYNVYFGVIGGDNAVSFDEALDEIVSLIRTEKLKLLAEVRERVQVNQKGQFEEDSTGNVCWYLDDLVEALKELEAEL